MAIDQKTLLQSVYDTIFDALTTTPSGIGSGQPVVHRDTTFLSLAFPGNPVDITQFANAWSPNNPQGSTFAAENYASFVDDAPALSTIFVPSGRSIDNMYGQIVRANVFPPDPDPRAQKLYQEKYNILHVDGMDYDDQGKPVKVKVDSPGFVNYKNNLALYNNAQLSYLTAYLQYDLSKPEDQRKWAILGPTLQGPVNIAYDNYQASSPGVYEDALAVVGQYEASSLAGLFSNARQLYTSTQRAGANAGPTWHECDAFPANWFAESAAANFAQFTLDSNRLRISENSSFSSFSGGGSVGFGLWSIGASVSTSSQHYDLSTDATNIRISFKLGRVEIRRRWLDASLFALSDWSVAGRKADAYSTGKLDADNDGIFPLLSTSFIVARDIQISGSWGQSDLHYAAQSTSISASVGWGPFSLSGTYQNSSSSRTFNSTFDGTTIVVPGIQVIGWVSALNPMFPPMSGEGASKKLLTELQEDLTRFNPYYSVTVSSKSTKSSMSRARWVSAER